MDGCRRREGGDDVGPAKARNPKKDNHKSAWDWPDRTMGALAMGKMVIATLPWGAFFLDGWNEKRKWGLRVSFCARRRLCNICIAQERAIAWPWKATARPNHGKAWKIVLRARWYFSIKLANFSGDRQTRLHLHLHLAPCPIPRPPASSSIVSCPRLFKKFRVWAGAQPLTALDKSKETLEMLEKKEKFLKEKASQEVVKAKEFSAAKDKRAAIQCLKLKKLYEQKIEQLGNLQLRIHDQMIMMEGAEATTETVHALRTGAAAMKAMQKAKNVDHVDNIMDEIDKQREAMKYVQEAVSAPSGAAADFDEDELEAELEELEGAELEEQLLLPDETASAVPFFVPAGLLPAPPVPQGTAREDEPEGAELEEQLLLPAATASAAPVHVIAGLLPAPRVPQRTDKEDELADEMAF